jgi:hypothetical protein
MSAESWNDVLERTRRVAPPTSDSAVSVQVAQGNTLLRGYGDPCKAAGPESNESLTRLVCIMGKEGFQPGGKAYRFFQYVHLDSDTDFGFTKDGQVFTLRFAGMNPVMVVVHGRNLLRICDSIHLHRMPWIRVADRDFADGQKEIITAIEIIEIAGQDSPA